MAARGRRSTVGFGLTAALLSALVGTGGLLGPAQDDPPGPPPADDRSSAVPRDGTPVTPAPVKRTPASDCRIACLPDVG